MSGLTRLELATSAVTGRCSNQLNYNPNYILYDYRSYSRNSVKCQSFYPTFIDKGETGIRTLGTIYCTID